MLFNRVDELKMTKNLLRTSHNFDVNENDDANHLSACVFVELLFFVCVSEYLWLMQIAQSLNNIFYVFFKFNFKH